MDMTDVPGTTDVLDSTDQYEYKWLTQHRYSSEVYLTQRYYTEEEIGKDLPAGIRIIGPVVESKRPLEFHTRYRVDPETCEVFKVRVRPYQPLQTRNEYTQLYIAKNRALQLFNNKLDALTEEGIPFKEADGVEKVKDAQAN